MSACFRGSLAVGLVGTLALAMGGMCGMDMNMDMDTETPPPEVYGDGSGGAKVVSSDENWNTAADAPGNLQFTSLMIESGATLTVPSGTVIRCTESFTNYGTVFVRQAAEGGAAGVSDPSGPDFSSTVVPPLPGRSTRAAQTGDSGPTISMLLAGSGGIGLSEFETRTLLMPGVTVGGGGAAGGMDTGSNNLSENQGADGGGSLVVLAAGEITNEGWIHADGQDGEQPSGMNDLGGGGGGGGIVLASMTSVTNNGTLTATGGNGADSDPNNGPSGGGGGGFVHMLAPEIADSGTTDASGGSAGANSMPITTNAERYAGGGGGASAGAGGHGGSIDAGLQPVAAGPAGDGAGGFVMATEVNPTALF